MHKWMDRLTQDCIENLFSTIRIKGGNNITPDSVKFRCNLRSVMINQLLQPSSDSNSEIDASTFLLQKDDILKQSVCVGEARMASTTANNEYSDINYNLAEKNAEYYVLEWVFGRLLHVQC